jgi:hypothetical protein
MKLSKFTFFVFPFLAPSLASACDLCGCYSPSPDAVFASPLGIYAGVSEQFTHFGSLRFDGHHVDNPTGQHLDSSITQIIAGYSFLQNRLTLQLNIPIISRSFKRPEGFEIEHGNESGLGDISLIANYQLLRYSSPTPPAVRPDGKSIRDKVVVEAAEPDFTMSLNAFAGVKFPTGDSSRLREEFEEVEIEGAPESGIHGHDLALGTGGWDAIFGTEFYARYKSAFFQVETQFTLRGDGLHSYHYANDLTWSGGPGWYFIRNQRDSLALQFVVAGEYKDTDRFQGRVAEDTGITAVYFGPRILGSVGRVSGEIGVDLPVLLDNTALQAVPDYRLRAGVTVHF